MNDGNDIESKISSMDSFWYVTEKIDSEPEFMGFNAGHNIKNDNYLAIRFVKK
jgi:hypothetical protein